MANSALIEEIGKFLMLSLGLSGIMISNNGNLFKLISLKILPGLLKKEEEVLSNREKDKRPYKKRWYLFHDRPIAFLRKTFLRLGLQFLIHPELKSAIPKKSKYIKAIIYS